MATKYELIGSDIHREGVKIASRDPVTGTIDYLPDCDRYRAPVSAWLSELGLTRPPVAPPEVQARQAKPKFVGSNPAAADGNATEDTEEPQDEQRGANQPTSTRTADQQRIAELEAQLAALKAAKDAPPAAAAPKPLAQPVDARFVAKDAQTGHVRPSVGDALLDPVKLRTYPDAPKYDHRGDKTPEFVDWLFANHPQDAVVRYLNRKLPGRSYDERVAELRAKGISV